MRSTFCKWWLVACFFVKATVGVSQQVAYFKITQQEGLPSNTIYDLFQDSIGYLWVATENGLARYNGSRFRYYNNPAVRSAAVGGLLQSTSGTIWLHNFSGEVLFVKGDSLQRLTSWEERYSEGFPSLSMAHDQLLISASTHLFQYNVATREWKQLDSSLYRGKSRIYFANHLLSDEKPFVSYSTMDTTFVTALDGSERYVLPQAKYPTGINVLRMKEWNKQLLLFAPTYHRVYQLHQGKVNEITDQFGDLIETTRDIRNLGDSLLAFMGSDGVRLLDRQHRITHLLPRKNISSIINDREGGVWVGTLNEGLFYFPNLKSQVFQKDSFSLFARLAVDTVNQRIFAGRYDGTIKIFHSDGRLQSELKNPSTKEVQSMLVDAANNRLLVFTDRLFWYRLDALLPEREFVLPAVKEMAMTNLGYALASSGGLIFVDEKTGAIRKGNLTAQRMTALYFDTKDQVLWIGGQKGLLTYSTLSDSVVVQPGGHANYPVGASAIVGYQDKVVVGTLTNGLLLLRDNRTIQHFTTEQGLPSNHITALCLYRNTLWIGTDRGIAALHLVSRSITTLDETKGLNAEETYDLAVIDNNLWVSHPQGLQFFESVPARNNQRPVLQLVSAMSHGVTQSAAEDKIILNSSSRQLSLGFDVANNLKAQGHTLLYYRIKELDGERWNKTNLQLPVANYQLLPFGNFTFEAYAVNEDGIRSSNTIVLSLSIEAPVWKRTWFIALSLLFVLLVISTILYYRVREINRRNRAKLMQQNQEQELRIAQLTSIRAQMNPHFIFNTMSLIQGNVLNGLKDEANQQIQNFSFLLRKVLDFSGKEMILLTEEVEVIEKYLAIERERFDGLLDYSIEMDEELKNEMIRIPSLLTQPFVENALRHGLIHKEGVKKLSIRFSLEGDNLKIHVRDNGVGRAAAAEFNKSRRRDHQSFAIEASHKRLELLNKTLQNKIKLEIVDHFHDNRQAAGTSVIISIPLDHDPKLL